MNMLFKIIGSPFPCCTRLIFHGEDDFLYRPTYGTCCLYRLIQVNSSEISTVKQLHDYKILTPGCIASFVSIKKQTSYLSLMESLGVGHQWEIEDDNVTLTNNNLHSVFYM